MINLKLAVLFLHAVLIFIFSRDLFFWLTTCLTESLVSGFIMNSNFYACTALILEVKSKPRTAKVVGSNLTRYCFFLILEIILSKQMSAYNLSAYILSA